jgi:hypothetical protein
VSKVFTFAVENTPWKCRISTNQFIVGFRID